MIIYEDYGKSPVGHDLMRAYSDQHFYITRNGALYKEDVYPKDMPRYFEETDILIEDEATAEDYEASLQDIGVNLNDIS